MLETLQYLINHYGYWAVALGALVEGEVSLLLGVVAAHTGILKLGGVMFAAFTGTMISDLGFYFAGRYFGCAALARRSRRWRARARLVERLIKRYDFLMLVGFRFMFGLRSVAPFVFGTIRVPLLRFTLLSGLGAILWTITFGLMGVILANTAQLTVTYIEQFQMGLLVLGSMVTAFLVYLLLYCRV